MCGIGGMFLREGVVDPERLQQCIAPLRHRGPDASGSYRHGPVGLVHTRLSIIDLGGGDQPLYNQDRSVCVVANGEIYNHIELRAELERAGHVFGTHSDCECIVHAYVEFGAKFLEHLEGMYSFALYDARRGRMILARDRLGIKPLFVSERPEGVYFASEMKALPEHARRAALRPDALVQYLNNNFISGRTTLLEGVERVLPGEWLAVEDGRVVQRVHYWSARHVEPVECSFEEAAAHFDGLIETVTRQHLRTDVPYGVFLSGGTDSSVIAALLGSFGSAEPVRSYTVAFHSADTAGQTADARHVAERWGTRHTVLELDRDALLRMLTRTTWAADDLMGDYANLPTAHLARRAARELKVVFSGEGGDETFAGYGRYRMGRWKRCLRALACPGTGGFRTKGVFPSRWASVLFGPELHAARDAWRTPFVAAWHETPAHWSRLQRMQYVDLLTWLPDDLLVKVDRVLMTYGLEGRVPLLDHRVVGFGLALPDRLKTEGRQGKTFLKRWAERWYPREHLWQKKKGFTVPVREWMQGPWLETLGAALIADPALQGWFRPAGIRRLVEHQRRRGGVHAMLWALLQLCLWHALFAAGRAAHEPPGDGDPLAWLAANASPKISPAGQPQAGK